MSETGVTNVPHAQLRQADLAVVRQAIRQGDYASHTAGLGVGKLQANLAIMPERYALDFMRFCQRNPKPCPLVGVTDTGNPMMTTVGDIDIRSDVPLYNVYRNGTLDSQVTDITDLWQDDFVAFALGCSYTFEAALIAAGIRMAHIEQDLTVPMYITNLQTVKSGPFGGGTVVSMRAIDNDQVETVVDICSRYPHAHGAPVHVGDPQAIGISQLAKPDWGDPPIIGRDQTTVFWACGVTPQNAIGQAGLPLFISHTPGRMLITDVPELAEVPVLA